MLKQFLLNGYEVYPVFFLFTRNHPDWKIIKHEWIESVVANPIREEIQSDGRIRRWARVPEAENGVLRVILLEDGETVHKFDSRPFGQTAQTRNIWR